MKLKGQDWYLELKISHGEGMAIACGCFGQAKLAEHEIFKLRMKNTENGEEIFLTSDKDWGSVECGEKNDRYAFSFSASRRCPSVSVLITAVCDEAGISWGGEVKNENEKWSAMEITYPMPLVEGKDMDLFVPAEGGQVVKNVADPQIFAEQLQEKIIPYPSRRCTMQFFAVYGRESGMYLGIHDGSAAAKEIRLSECEYKLGIEAKFYGIGATLAKNSFALRGVCRWQVLRGDWYDAALLYRDFVQKEAFWLPKTGPDGNPETENRFKDLPFWVNSGMRNPPLKEDNTPDLSWEDPDDVADEWCARAIELQKELGVPMGMHLYNWHYNRFDTDYPHFKARKACVERISKLHDNNILVVPYINGISWEMGDGDEGFEVNYENTGKKGVAIKEDGSERYTLYKGTQKNGVGSRLAPMCPTFRTWWDIMDKVSEHITDEVGMDGVYYDQITAHAGFPCYSHDHGHLPGGGSYWAEGYVAMMQKIRQRKSSGFCFSESTSESYMKGLDGLLSWTWACNGEVPAFSTVYAGYTVLLGRTFNQDDGYFRYAMARSLLYGQQLGWCNPTAVLGHKERLEFLKKLVKLRYEHAVFFRSATMCRPPKVTTEKQPLTVPPPLWFKAAISAPVVESTAWKSYDGKKILVFVTNIAQEDCDYSLSFSASEYGVDTECLPSGFALEGDRVVFQGVIPALHGFATEFICR